MNLISLTWVIGAVAASCLCCSRDTGDAVSAAVELHPRRIDVEMGPDMSTASFTFSLANQSPETHHVTAVTASCGCQSIDGPIGAIPPFGSLEYSGTIELSGYQDKNYLVSVYVNGRPMNVVIHASPGPGWYWMEDGVSMGGGALGDVCTVDCFVVHIRREAAPDPPVLDESCFEVEGVEGQWSFAVQALPETEFDSKVSASWRVTLTWTPSGVEVAPQLGRLVARSATGEVLCEVPIVATQQAAVIPEMRILPLEADSAAPAIVPFLVGTGLSVSSARCRVGGSDWALMAVDRVSSSMVHCSIDQEFLVHHDLPIRLQVELETSAGVISANVLLIGAGD